MYLFLEPRQGNAGRSRHGSQRNQEQSQIESCRQPEEWNFGMIGQQGRIESKGTNGPGIKRRGPHLEGARQDGKQKWSALDEEECHEIDKELLVVGSDRQETEFFGEGQQFFNRCQVDAVGFQTGENASIGSRAEEVELADAANDIVLSFVNKYVYIYIYMNGSIS